MPYIRRDGTGTQKALNRKVHLLEYKKSMANLNGDIKLANEISIQIKQIRRRMGELAYGKA